VHVHALLLILTQCLEGRAAVGTRRSSAAVPRREGREIADYFASAEPDHSSGGMALCSVVGRRRVSS